MTGTPGALPTLLPVWAQGLPKHFTASGFVLRNGRILLVNHRKHHVEQEQLLIHF